MADEWLTERLRARPPRPADWGGYRALFRDPAIEEWLRPAPLPPFGDEDIRAMLHADELHWDLHQFGPWALLDRSDESLVGRGGLRWLELEGQLVVELPWTVASDRQGEGLAGEAAAAAVSWARTLALADVVALVRPQNAASLRVAEKAGLRREREAMHAGLPHLVYVLP